MKIGFYLLGIIGFILYTNAEKRYSNALLSSIQRLQFQLFKSMQWRVNVLKTATFVTKCSDAGCSKHTKCQAGFTKYRDHCYKHVTTKMNFFDAEMFCRTQQASLVEINDAYEERWIRSIFKKSWFNLWISANDLSRNGQWKWLSSGLPLRYTNWAPSQPGNSHEHCALIASDGWHDYPCSVLVHSVCEYSP